MSVTSTAMKIALLAEVFLCAAALQGAEHQPLLPRPQSIQYGPGKLKITGLSIEFRSEPGVEDRFAATELQQGIARRTGVNLPISSTSRRGPAIVLARTGAVDALPIPGEKPGPDSREAYRLSITSQAIQISGRSSASLFYGVQTLLQTIEGEGQAAYFPELEVGDWPSTAYRGTLVDVGSEGPMCTESEVERQLDFLSTWKANQYYLYSETSIELDGYPLLSPDARFTKDQIRNIIAYGRARHIDVIPAVELYGHLHDLFRIEKYSDLSDFPHGGEFNPANPRVRAVLDDWIAQLAALFSSPFVIVGFDETWSIQKAADKSGENATPVQLFIDQLSHVATSFQVRGKTVMAYADIMVKFPGIIAKLPPGLIAVPWYYDPSPDPDYKRWLDPLIAYDVPNMVASGVSSWVEIAPDFEKTFANVDTLLAAGRKAHTLGLLNTVWTDDNQVLLRMSWPGIAYGAIAPWQSRPIDQETFFAEYAQIMYPPAASSEMAAALTSLNASELAFQKAAGVETMAAVWNDPFAPSTLKHMEDQRDHLRQTRLLAEDAQEHLIHAQSLGADPVALANFVVGARLLDYAGMKYIYALELNDLWATLPQKPSAQQVHEALAVGVDNYDHSRLADLIDGISQLRPRYRAAWLSQYTDYRLATALGRWDAEYEYWRLAQTRFEAFTSNFKSGDTLPSLQDVVESSPNKLN
jgi:hexosaminidase